MKPVWPNKNAQKMPSMAARLPRPAADGLYLAIPIPYPHFGVYKISNVFSISLCKPQVNYIFLVWATKVDMFIRTSFALNYR